MGKRKRKFDPRPICDCTAYKFPHKVGGGKCDGSKFAEDHYYSGSALCRYCNLNTGSGCDAINGSEDIKLGECYQEQLQLNS